MAHLRMAYPQLYLLLKAQEEKRDERKPLVKA